MSKLTYAERDEIRSKTPRISGNTMIDNLLTKPILQEMDMRLSGRIVDAGLIGFGNSIISEYIQRLTREGVFASDVPMDLLIFKVDGGRGSVSYTPHGLEWIKKFCYMQGWAWIDPISELPRCSHGNALCDWSGEWLRPSCGCHLNRQTDIEV